MNKITVVCHKDHSQGYEDFEGRCLLCVVDELVLEIGNLMIQKRRAEKREWVDLTPTEVGELTVMEGLDHVETPFLANLVWAVEKKVKEKNGE